MPDREQPQRKYGFPLRMLIGFAIGAGVATVVAFVLAAGAERFSYTALFDLVVALGALGTYLGHVTGAVKHKDAGFKPWGPITPNVLMVGGAIVLFGTLVVVGAVMGIMTLIKGGPPPH
jgi:hypothetical protein